MMRPASAEVSKWVSIMKIYTKTGDQGQTSLLSGMRVRKDDPRIEAYGEVDELNATLGLARAKGGQQSPIDEILTRIQSDLFLIGAELATPESTDSKNPRVGSEEISQLERDIDRLDEQLPGLKNFILPGGSELASVLHVARTVCRRAERKVIKLPASSDARGNVVIYLNRLSDLLFVMARYVNHGEGIPDIPWTA